MQTQIHKITFEGLTEEDGSISFSNLFEFFQAFTRVAEGALLSYTTGSSKRMGKPKDWLNASMDFKFKGIHPGSTIIDVEAPVLNETLNELQGQLFFGEELGDFDGKTAVELGMYAFEHALAENSCSPILDKNLLIEMEKLQKFFKHEELTVSISGNKNKKLTLKKKDFAKITHKEHNTPMPFKTKVTGKLDVMKHTQGQLELVVQNKRIKCIPPPGKLGDLLPFFGKMVVAIGNVHFGLSGEITSFEIQHIEEATSADDFFKQLPRPYKEFTSLEDLAKEQGYKKTNLDNVVGKWETDLTMEELLKGIDE